MTRSSWTADYSGVVPTSRESRLSQSMPPSEDGWRPHSGHKRCIPCCCGVRNPFLTHG